MKKTIHLFFILSLLVGINFFFGCQLKKAGELDTKKEAEKANQVKFTTRADEKDAQFVVDQVAGNQAEIEMAKLAIKRSQNDELKQIADKLEKDHTIFLNGLNKMAAEKEVTIPAEETADVKAQIKRLEDTRDTAFDKAWCEALLDKHTKAIPKLEAAQKTLSDPDLKKWVEDILPIARSHVDKLMAIHYKLK